MELLIAVIGLIIYGALIGHGRAQNKAFNRNFERRWASKDLREKQWLAKVFNVTKTHECWEFTEDHYSEIPHMLAEAYAALPSYSDMTIEEIERSITSYRKINKDCRNRVEWNFQAWYMSRQGLSAWCFDGALEEFDWAYTEREKKAWDRKYEFVMMLLREIRKTAPETRVVFTQAAYTVSTDFAYDAEKDLPSFRYKRGELHYLQLTWLNDDLTRL